MSETEKLLRFEASHSVDTNGIARRRQKASGATRESKIAGEVIFRVWHSIYSKCQMLIVSRYDEFDNYSTESIDKRVSVIKRKVMEVFEDCSNQGERASVSNGKSNRSVKSKSSQATRKSGETNRSSESSRSSFSNKQDGQGTS